MNKRRWLVMILALACMSRGYCEQRELGWDDATVFLGHFNGTLETVSGDLPLDTSGCEFRPGIIGQGVYLDALDVLIYDATEHFTPAEGSIELWFCPSWNGNDNYDYPNYSLMYVGDHENNFRLLAAQTSLQSNFSSFHELVWYHTGTISWIHSWVKDYWRHIAVTWKVGEFIKVYLDGALVTTRVQPMVLIEPPEVIYLGLANGTWIQRCHGIIDEVRISSRARTAAEIAAAYAEVLNLYLTEIRAYPGGGQVEVTGQINFDAEGLFLSHYNDIQQWLPLDGYVSWQLTTTPPGCAVIDEATGLLQSLEPGTVTVQAALPPFSSNAPAVQIVTENPAYVPCGLQATPYKSSVELSWSKSAQSDQYTSGYGIYRREYGSGQPFPEEPGVVIEDDEVLTARDFPPLGGLRYEYQVGAIDRFGNRRVLRSAATTCDVTALPDLDVTHIERTPRYRRNLGGQQKTWPAQDEVVTFTAHVMNKGNVSSQETACQWLLDGDVVIIDTLPEIAVDDEAVVLWQWQWDQAEHILTFAVDTSGCQEVSNLNDSLTIGTLDLMAALWVEDSVYNYFNTRESALGSFSWEDWANAEMLGFVNETLAAAQYPLTQQGIRERVRIDYKAVIGDGIIYNAAYPPFRVDEEPNYDNVWGWPINLIAPPADPEAPDFIGGVTHEWGHQWGLPDLYALNVVGSDVLVKDFNGELVVGTDALPLMPYGIAYLTDRLDTMMGNNYTRWSDFCAYLLDFKTHLRRPDLVAPHLADFAEHNYLQLLSAEGEPLVGATVWVYQVTEVFWDWYRKVVDNVPDIIAFSDEQGLVAVGAEPFGDYSDSRFAEGMMLVKVRANSQIEYIFKDQIEFNLAYWSGAYDACIVPLETTILASAIPGAVNLAYEKATSASSELYRRFSHYAVNGDKTTYGLTWAPATPTAGEWLKVDLGTLTQVSSVRIYPAIENWLFWYDQFRVEVSATGEFSGEEVTVVTELDWPDRMTKLYRFAPQECRYVKIIGEVNQPSGGGAHLQEVEIFGVALPAGDSDQDGLPDEWESEFFGGLGLGPDDDSDNDGLTNLQEWDIGSDPTLFDSDFDGWSDSWEFSMGFDPTTDDRVLDNDLDGVSNHDEYYAETDPHDPTSYPLLFETFTVYGETGEARVGSAIDVLTAFDATGSAAILIGNPYSSSNGNEAGALHVIDIKADMPTYQPISSALVTIVGETAYDRFGYQVCSLGDLNHDGLADFAVSAPYKTNPAMLATAGAVYIFYGQEEQRATMQPASTADAVLYGGSEGELAGWSLAAAGDLNGDGYSDMLIGAPGCMDQSGRVYVLYGSSTMLSGVISLETIASSIVHEQAGDSAGYACAGGGDLNGDGFDDLAFSAYQIGGSLPESGSVYLFWGSSQTLPVSTPSSYADVIFYGAAAFDQAGAAIALAQDLDRDGFGDLIIGTPGCDSGAGDAGAVMVIYGHAESWPTAVVLDSTVPGILGAEPLEGFGAILPYSAVLLEGEQPNAILSAAPETLLSQGSIVIVASQGLRLEPDTPLAETLRYCRYGYDYDDRLGSKIVAHRDLTQDGYGDLLIGATEYYPGGSGGGRVEFFVSQGLPHPVTATQLALFHDPECTIPVTGALAQHSTGYLQALATHPYHRSNTLRVAITSDSDPTGIESTLTAVSLGSSIFRGVAQVSGGRSNQAMTRIQVSPGDDVRFTSIETPTLTITVPISTAATTDYRAKKQNLRSAR